LSNHPTETDIASTIDNLKMISSEAKRCGDMVKNLLLFSKRRYEEASKNDLVPIINRSMELVRASNKTGNISLKQEITAQNTWIYCDPSDIQQMLLIFLINAMEAVANVQNPEILLRVSDVNGGKILRIEIIDNGIGIPKDVISRIFEPFFTTKKTPESTGLGLSVAYRIAVVRHGGEISVDSKVNEGTTFTIDFPVEGPEHKISDNLL
jgi:two-component system NtrC family sensor kinase